MERAQELHFLKYVLVLGKRMGYNSRALHHSGEAHSFLRRGSL